MKGKQRLNLQNIIFWIRKKKKKVKVSFPFWTIWISISTIINSKKKETKLEQQ